MTVTLLVDHVDLDVGTADFIVVVLDRRFGSVVLAVGEDVGFRVVDSVVEDDIDDIVVDSIVVKGDVADSVVVERDIVDDSSVV